MALKYKSMFAGMAAFATLALAGAGPAGANGLFHEWSATVRYGQGAGPVKDDPLARGDGYARSEGVRLGLGARVGTHGFVRVQAGRDWHTGKRALQFDDLRAKTDFESFGVIGGVFALPFLAFGMSWQTSDVDGSDTFTNAFGGQEIIIERSGRSDRFAPFMLLTGPVGAVNVSLLTAYVHVASRTDYAWPAALSHLDSSDTGRLDLHMADLSGSMQVHPRIRLGASIGRSSVLSQRTQGSDLPLDGHWYTFGVNATLRLSSRLGLNLDASHEAGNARGDGYGWGVGLAYRF